MIYIFHIDNNLLIITDVGDVLTSNESENTSDQECWNSKRKECAVFPPHAVEHIRRDFQSLIEAPPQQKISQKIFGEQTQRDELAVLKEKYIEATLLSKIRRDRKSICQGKNSLFSKLLQIYSFY